MIAQKCEMIINMTMKINMIIYKCKMIKIHTNNVKYNNFKIIINEHVWLQIITNM